MVTVALPRIGVELPALVLGVLEGQSYVFNAYLLVLSALVILAGALNDYYGRRRMFALGLVGFAVTSAGCGLASNLELLILARILQGAAGALLVPGSLALITANFEGEKQGRAYGIWAATSAATAIVGPLIGGLLVDLLSWRMVFLINLPLAGVALWAVARYVRESRAEGASGRFDWLGAAVAAIAVGGLAFGATNGQQREWHDPVAFWTLALGAGAALLFPFLMLRRSNPLVPPELFRSRNFVVTNLTTFLVYGALYVSLYHMPLFLQGTLRYTALGAGIAFMPGPLLLVFLSTRFGTWAARYGPRRFMAIGPALISLGFLWIAQIPSTGDGWAIQTGVVTSHLPPLSYVTDVLPGTLLMGLGLAVLVAPLTAALMQSVSEDRAGLASAINNAISRVGSPLIGALIFVFVTSRFYLSLAEQVPGLDPTDPGLRELISPLNRPLQSVSSALLEASRQASTEVFHVAMLVAASLMLAGGVIAFLGISNQLGRQAPGQRDAAIPEA